MTGEGWRIFAIVIYVLICLLPALGLLLIRRRRRPWREDWLLLVLSAALFLLLFPNFCVRMEVVYFEGDKLDREDELHSYRRY